MKLEEYRAILDEYKVGVEFEARILRRSGEPQVKYLCIEKDKDNPSSVNLYFPDGKKFNPDDFHGLEFISIKPIEDNSFVEKS